MTCRSRPPEARAAQTGGPAPRRQRSTRDRRVHPRLWMTATSTLRTWTLPLSLGRAVGGRTSRRLVHDVVSIEAAIQRAPADPEHAGCRHAIAIHLAQHFENVLAFDGIERGH